MKIGKFVEDLKYIDYELSKQMKDVMIFGNI